MDYARIHVQFRHPCSAHALNRCDLVTHFCLGTSRGDIGRAMAIGAADPATLTERSADVAGHMVAHVESVG